MSTGCLIFDLDGTLADTLPDLTLAVNGLRAHFELPPLPQEIVATYVGNGVEKLIERSLAGSGVPVSEAREVMRECYAQSLNMASKLYPGVYVGLKRLRAAGWKLALLSNKPDDFCKFILYDFGIGQWFDIIIGGSPDYPLKPDPTGVFAILELLGVEDKDRAWMCGDSVPDLEVGARAGIHTAWCSFGYGNSGDCRYDLRCDTFSQFTDTILEKY